MCPLRVTVDAVQRWTFIQGAVGSRFGLRCPTHPGVVRPHGVSPDGRWAGGAAAERSHAAVGRVEVPLRLRRLLAADDADESSSQQKQQGGDPADVDGGAHLPLQGCRHQGVVVD